MARKIQPLPDFTTRITDSVLATALSMSLDFHRHTTGSMSEAIRDAAKLANFLRLGED